MMRRDIKRYRTRIATLSAGQRSASNARRVLLQDCSKCVLRLRDFSASDLANVIAEVIGNDPFIAITKGKS
jgi:hypothetical protein